jgi:hypothetical protein
VTAKTDLDLAAVTEKLRWLKMPGMARGLDAIVERAASHNLTPLEIADALAEAEKQSRIRSAIERRVRGARFAEINTVDGFRLRLRPGAPQATRPLPRAVRPCVSRPRGVPHLHRRARNR